MKRRAKLLVLAVAALLVGGGTAIASAGPDATSATPDATSATPDAPAAGRALAQDLRTVDRTAVWSQVSVLDLKFPTYHPEGLVVTADRIYLSSTQIIEPTVKYPTPRGRYDRTPGSGIGHLFVISRAGQLLRDITLGHGIVYHPGGIDFDGRDIWVPVAQYRPNSTAEIDRVDVSTLAVTRQFTVDDHIGGIVYDRSSGKLVGNNWGSRRFYDWTRSGREVATWRNPDDLLDDQDCQYVSGGLMSCGGITALPQTPPAGGSAAAYELGGIVLYDLHRHTVVNEIPFQYWSAAGHVLTRNPVKLTADGRTMELWAAPDNGEDVAGTQLFRYRTTLPG